MWSNKLKQLPPPTKSPRHKIYAQNHKIKPEQSAFLKYETKSKG